MKTRRVLAGALALTMTVSMFTSCGSVADSKGTDSKEIKSVAEQIVSDSSVVEDSSIVEDSSVEEDSSVVDAVSATETFDTEIAKLSDYFNGDLKSGNISLSAKVDMKNTNESFNWEKAAKYGTGGLDMVTDWGVVWDSGVLDFNISIDKKPVIATGIDADYLYIDLSAFKDMLQAIGAWNEDYEDNSRGYSAADLFTMLKIDKNIPYDDVLDTFAVGFNTDAYNSAALDEQLDTSMKAIFNDAVISDLKKIGEKAEYNGENIVIRDLTTADFSNLYAAMSDLVRGDVTANAKLNKPTTYTLSYDADNFKQVHTISIDDADSAVTLIFTVTDKPEGLNMDKYSSARTVEDITGGDITTEEFLSGLSAPKLLDSETSGSMGTTFE